MRRRARIRPLAAAAVPALALLAALFAHGSPALGRGAVAAGDAAGPGSSSGASAAATVVVSPLAGTPDANPHTQISFLGAPASRLRDIVVTGSESGSHAGRLEPYSTHTGGSFLPDRPFVAGEHVSVSATVVGSGAPRQIGTGFTISSPYELPASPPGRSIPSTAWNVLHFHSRHDLQPPAFYVTTPAADASLGDVFLTPNDGPGQRGPMIVSPTGELVWFRPLPAGTKAFDLNVQDYLGRRVLTWWQGQVVEGHGQGEDVIESSRYTPIATVRAGNGLRADLHDFQITPQGTAWVTAFAPEHMNLSAYGGGADGLIDDGVVQEIDIRTGLVMFSWHALGHVAISDTYMNAPNRRGAVLDYFHVNSIDPLPGGQLLISSRNTWATYLISETTGAIIWRLGGKRSTFRLGPGVSFAWQHDAEMLPNGTISLFDNDSAPPEARESSALDIALSTSADTATLVRQYTYPGYGILSASQGDAQLLPNGDEFVGWGQVGKICEFSPAGTITFNMHLVSTTDTYRAFRYPWSSQPQTRPALRVARHGDRTTQVWASWNGATDVASWRVLAGDSARALRTVGTHRSSGFETSLDVPTAARYVRVEALSASGRLLRASAVARAGA